MTSSQAMTRARLDARALLSKVPEVTIFFWIIKILATTIGETAADYLADNLGFGLTGTTWVMSALLVGVLVFQFRAPRYVPAIYWLVVVVLSIVGTTVQAVGSLLVLRRFGADIVAFFIWQTAIAGLQAMVIAATVRALAPRRPGCNRFDAALLRRTWRFALGMSGISLLTIALTQTGSSWRACN
jgi:uncharacterized membrane-anchored protein